MSRPLNWCSWDLQGTTCVPGSLARDALAQAAMSSPCQGGTLLPSLLTWSFLAATASRINPFHFSFPEPPNHKLEEGKKQPQNAPTTDAREPRGEPAFRGCFKTLLNYHFLSIIKKLSIPKHFFAERMRIIKHAEETYNYAKLNCMAASLWP